MKKKKSIKKKVVLGIIGLLLTVIIGYIAAWGINYYKYYKWERMLEYDERRHGYLYAEGDYLYCVGKPVFLDFTGNFAISHSIGGEEEEQVYFSVIIWPKGGKDYEMGVEITVVEWNEKEQDFERTGYQVMLDENLELDLKGRTEFSKDEKKMIKGYEDNKEELHKLLDRASELWNLEYWDD